ncbi:hypothetical protein BH23BAC1_BH23BAC1_45630 [soil metagenome]
MKEIYQIQIALKRVKPKIWRRVLVPSDLLLSSFHKVIQTTMGWTNSHLHQFIKGGKHYIKKFPDDDLWDDTYQVDYKKMKISNLLKAEKEHINYEYDFGDGWIHQITLEKIFPVDKNVRYPYCIAGKMNCPPEDCGGPWGYENMMEILKQPKHEEYESYLEWLGGKFDPEEFNIDEVNDRLKEKNYGCFPW